MAKIQYQRFVIPAIEAASNKQEFDLDSKTEQVLAVQVTSNHPDKAYFRGSQRVELNGQELFPEGYESKLLLANNGVAPNRRFYELGNIEPGNKKIKIGYADTAHASAPFAAYNVVYVFKTLVRE